MLKMSNFNKNQRFCELLENNLLHMTFFYDIILCVNRTRRKWRSLVKKNFLTMCSCYVHIHRNSYCILLSFNGDDGQEVMAIQNVLVELHCTINTIDGDFGHFHQNCY